MSRELETTTEIFNQDKRPLDVDLERRSVLIRDIIFLFRINLLMLGAFVCNVHEVLILEIHNCVSEVDRSFSPRM